MSDVRRTTAERFEEKYVPVPESGCWLWEAGHFGNGYPAFKAGGRTSRSQVWNIQTRRQWTHVHD